MRNSTLKADKAIEKLEKFLKNKRLPLSTQKFHKGDVVWVAKDLGSTMAHFTGGCHAVVAGSYTDICSSHGTNNKDYGLILIPEDTRPH